MSFELEILVPDGTLLQTQVESIQAADASGRFGLLPHHEAFLTLLVPCILEYRVADGTPRYAAADGGVLLMEGDRASVVTRDAVVADRLEEVADAAAAMLKARRAQETWRTSGVCRVASFARPRIAPRGEAEMSRDQQHEDPFVAEIRRQAAQAQAGRRSGFWRGLAAVGAVGWMVSLPAVCGALLGRWLDARFASGLFWTLSLLVAGVLLGCSAAWRHMSKELKE